MTKSKEGKKNEVWLVISLGGSLIVPKEGIDIGFLQKFRDLVTGITQEGRKVLVVTGGGTIARQYQEAGKELDFKQEELDWLGIMVTRLNATLVRDLFPEAAKEIITNPEEEKIPNGKIVIAAGWKPGFSTDYDAALLAKRVGAKRIVNLSNVAYVYDEDPKENPQAKRYKQLSWEKFRSIVGKEWTPGINAPFDPIAAKLCEEEKIEVAVVGGEDLENAKRAMIGKFEGTLIRTLSG